MLFRSTTIRQIPPVGDRMIQGDPVSIVISRGTLLSFTLEIKREDLPVNAHLEIIVEDYEGRHVVVDRIVPPGEDDVREPVSGLAPYRLIVKINGRVDRDQTIGQGGN